MSSITQRKTKRCLIAVVVLAAVLVITLFSSCFTIKEAHHDCSGADCPICAVIDQCEENLRQISSGQITMTAVVTAISFSFFAILFAITSTSTETLISQKVRLNN